MSEYIIGTDGNGGNWLTGERIIRCRDCKHSHLTIGRELVCLKLSPSDDDSVLLTVQDNFFCGLGEPKEDQ